MTITNGILALILAAISMACGGTHSADLAETSGYVSSDKQSSNWRKIEVEALPEGQDPVKEIKKIIASPSKDGALVLFSASWCGPCQIMKPHFEELGKNYKGGRYTFVYVDLGYSDVGRAFNIEQLPTTVLYQNGAESMRHIGSIGSAELISTKFMLDLNK